MRSALPLLIALLGSPAIATPAEGSEEAVVADAQAAISKHFIRPVHCAAAKPGSFGALADPSLRELNKLVHELLGGGYYTANPELHAVARGERPVEALTAAQRRFVEAAAPAARRVLEATCAEDGRLPDELSAFTVLSHHEAYSGFEVQLAVTVAVIGARMNPSAQALRAACLDGLAVARDLSSGYLVPRMVSLSVLKAETLPVCSAAIQAAEAKDLPGLASAIRLLSAWPPFGDVFGGERLFAQLAFFGDTLSSATAAALPEIARQTIRDAGSGGVDRSQRFAGARRFLFGSWARRKQYAQMTAAMDACDLPLDKAAAKLDEIFAETPLALTLFGDDGTPSRFSQYLRRDSEAQALVQMLIAAAAAREQRLSTGKWPSRVDQLASAFDVHRAGAMLLVPEGDALVLKLATAAIPENPPPEIRVAP